jgi:hypothetical protein
MHRDNTTKPDNGLHPDTAILRFDQRTILMDAEALIVPKAPQWHPSGHKHYNRNTLGNTLSNITT